MKTIGVFLFGLFFMCSTLIVHAGDVTKSIKGTWTIRVPEAPYGHQDYKMTVTETEGVYKANILGSGVDVKDQKLDINEGKLTTEVFVGEYVNVTIWEEDNVVKGLAETSMGKLPILFKKDQK